MTIRQACVSALFALALALALPGVALALHGNNAGSGYAAGAPTRLASTSNAAANDYDSDNDGLIEVDSLSRLNAIRWDLDGDGAADAVLTDADAPDAEATAENVSRYAAAFPNPAPGMGCPPAGCAGYELTQNLDFDTDGDGATYAVSSGDDTVTGDADDAYYNDGQGWLPIGSLPNPYNAAFNGNGYTIANLFINTSEAGLVGLFGVIDANGGVQNLGLIDVNVSRSTGGTIGSLAATNMGTVTNCYATGSISGSGEGISTIGGLVGQVRLGGTINHSYAAVAVSGKDDTVFDWRDRIGGLTGVVTHPGSAIIASYATGPVSAGSYARAGGLVGSLWRAGAITSSYATGAVSGGEYSSVGGLVGLAGVDDNIITASYAVGSVSGGASSSVGGLAGYADGSGRITDSYAIGAVSAPDGSNLGGLTASGNAAVTNSYWNSGSTGQVASASTSGTGRPTRDLQSPTSDTDSYETWQSTQWDFGTARQYPAVRHNGDLVPGQRQTSLQVDWNHPVVGEPVVAGLNVDGADNLSWQWQRSATGAKWRNIPDADAPAYVPVAADAAAGGQFLRAQITFTQSGKRHTLTTYNTAKVVARTTAESAADTSAFVPDVAVGRRLEYAIPGADITHQTYRWQQCANPEMTRECRYLPTGAAAYTITAADLGKYLRAYVYYAEGAAWKRAESPVHGPVIAAP